MYVSSQIFVWGKLIIQNSTSQVNTCSTPTKSLYYEKLTVAVCFGVGQTLNLIKSTFSVAQISIPVVGVTCTIDPILIIDRSRISQAGAPRRVHWPFIWPNIPPKCMKMTEIGLRWVVILTPPFHLPMLIPNSLSQTSLPWRFNINGISSCRLSKGVFIILEDTILDVKQCFFIIHYPEIDDVNSKGTLWNLP